MMDIMVTRETKVSQGTPGERGGKGLMVTRSKSLAPAQEL